jgi:hypothetical protein
MEKRKMSISPCQIVVLSTHQPNTLRVNVYINTHTCMHIYIYMYPDDLSLLSWQNETTPYQIWWWKRERGRYHKNLRYTGFFFCWTNVLLIGLWDDHFCNSMRAQTQANAIEEIPGYYRAIAY